MLLRRVKPCQHPSSNSHFGRFVTVSFTLSPAFPGEIYEKAGDKVQDKGEERRKLVAFIVGLEDQSEAQYASKLAQRIDGRSPDRWLGPVQCEQELGLSSDAK